jgi:hypothetical protein
LQVPTRTLVQIRTHAQKYFLKHQMPPTRADDGLGSLNGFGSAVNAMPGFEGLLEGEGDMEGAGGARGDQTLKPVATIRHVALEPLHPGDQLGIVFRQSPTTGECAAAVRSGDSIGGAHKPCDAGTARVPRVTRSLQGAAAAGAVVCL